MERRDGYAFVQACRRSVYVHRDRLVAVVGNVGIMEENTAPAEVSSLPVVAMMLTFFVWCINIQSANEQSEEVALGIAFLMSSIVCLGYTIACLAQNPNGFRKWFFLSWAPSSLIAITLLLQSNPLGWEGIEWGVFVPQLMISTLPCLALYLVSRGNAGSIYAVPVVVVSYFVVMLVTWW